MNNKKEIKKRTSVVRNSIKKDEIKEMIRLIRQFNGQASFSFIPSKKIYSTEDLYGLYYGGWNKIEVGKYFRSGSDFFEIDDSNIDEIVDKIYKKLSDDVGECILKALENLGMDDCNLKYFDRDEAELKKFQEEVLRLKKN